MTLNKRSVLATIAVLSCGLFFILSLLDERSSLGLRRGKMPSCDSATTRSLVQRSFAGSPSAQQRGLKLIKIGNVSDVEHGSDSAGKDPKKTSRLCTATLFTNAGTEPITFRLSWMDDQKTELWLESQ